MKATLQPRVKICCISSHEEAQLAIDYGAAAIGLVGAMPSGPGIITNSEIKSIAKTIPPGISSFLLTSETSTKGIIAHHNSVSTNTIQLVDALKHGSYSELRANLPSIKLVQVIHVVDNKSVEEAIHLAQFVDAILVDSGNPKLAIKELGGTGRTHNWTLSKMIREEINIPLFLAGGLNKDNIRAAINIVQPYGVDLCSGVRTDGKLDAEKLKGFFDAIKAV